MYRSNIAFTLQGLLVGLLVLPLFLTQANSARADITLAIQPSPIAVDNGEIFDVELTVTDSAADFNGFDAFIGYDPTRLTFIEQLVVTQQGALMQDACPISFHQFDIADDSTYVSINYIILCAGVTVTGPGVIYNLRFQAKYTDGPTTLSILTGTQFFNAGIFVSPLITEDGVVVIGTQTDVPSERLETGLRLNAAPNPFNPVTVLSFEIPQSSPVTLAVYSSAGKRITTLVDGFLEQGLHELLWDGRDHHGRRVASGAYRVRLEAAGKSKSMSVVLVK